MQREAPLVRRHCMTGRRETVVGAGRGGVQAVLSREPNASCSTCLPLVRATAKRLSTSPRRPSQELGSVRGLFRDTPIPKRGHVGSCMTFARVAGDGGSSNALTSTTSTSQKDMPDELETDIARLVARLAPQPERPFVLHDVVGLSVSEIAVEMGVREGTVRSWLSRSRATLRSQIARTYKGGEEAWVIP